MCSVDKRNLYAHGGFEKNVTFLWNCGEDICVDYKGVDYKDCIKNVEEQL
ncbi:TM1812 family CRISPR-associated protein [Acidianus infernus]